MNSKIAYLISIALLTFFTAFFYPKWEKPGTEATLSWDVSGYYLYLPAIFIYDDLTQLEFLPEIIQKYQPTTHNQQAFRFDNGNFVMKYSSGQALMYLPFFSLAHLYASLDSTYPADGFSLPYQFAIGFGGLLIAFLGLWFLRKILLEYFSESATSWTLLVVVFATNYLEYGGVTGAMTHNWLFTLYTLLIWVTIKFYREPTLWRAVGIGALVGLAALTRPTEIVSCLVPLLWGITNRNEFQERISFYLTHYRHLILAGVSCALVGMIQLLYWKGVSGDFIVYSYEEEGFSWLKPHFVNGLFSYRAGWLIYSPASVFFLFGIPLLFIRKTGMFWAVLIYLLVHLYITIAWDIWWYGGSLGQRSMVQSIPILAFGFAAFVEWVQSKKILSYVVLGFCLLFSYYNIWLVTQAHGGGLLHVSQMTKAYFWEVVGRYGDFPLETQKLLDTKEMFKGERQEVSLIFSESFDQYSSESTHHGTGDPTDQWLLVAAHMEKSPQITLDASLIPENTEWLRIRADHFTHEKDWNPHSMAQLTVIYSNQGKRVKGNKIRVHRFLTDNTWYSIYMDTSIPDKPFTHVEIYYKNGLSPKFLYVNNLEVEAFR